MSSRQHTERADALARRLLPLMAQGLSNNQIAARLYLSPGTVGAYMQQLYKGLDARNRANAVAIGYRDGLITEYPR